VVDINAGKYFYYANVMNTRNEKGILVAFWKMKLFSLEIIFFVRGTLSGSLKWLIVTVFHFYMTSISSNIYS